MAKKKVPVELLFEVFEIFENEESFGGDHYEYAMFLNGEMVKLFGDQYHDKSRETAQGYIDGYVTASGKSHEVIAGELASSDAHDIKKIIKAYKKAKKG